jgi:dephospho-CoA kinase
VLAAFARRGIPVASSDSIVHELYRADPEVRAAVVERFGAGVLGADGEVDRARIAGIVFERPEELAWLEALLHPRVQAEYTRLRDGADAPVFVVEVPLLYEGGGDRFFDRVVVVTAPAEERARRLGRLPAERERRLLPEEEKVRRADFVFVNDGTPADADAFVADVLARLAA